MTLTHHFAKSALGLSIVIVLLSALGLLLVRHRTKLPALLSTATGKSSEERVFLPKAWQSQYKEPINLYFRQKGYAVVWVDAPGQANLQVSSTGDSTSWPIQTQTIGKTATLMPGADMVVATEQTNAFITLGAAVTSNLHPGDSATALASGLATVLRHTKPSNIWTVKALGDVILGRTVYKIMNQQNDWSAAFAKTSSFTKDADLTLADFESTLSDTADHPTLGMTFSAPSRAAAGLNFAGIDAVNVANNHAYNQGSKPFVETLKTLKDYNVPYFGGGINASEAHRPLIKEVKGIKVALLGYSSIIGTHEAGTADPGQAYLSMQPWGQFDEARAVQMESDIRAAKQQADLVFVYYHWGVEYTHTANDDQRAIAHRAIEAGADVILGTHPHWVQGVEWYKNKLITYSLGNFVFDQEWSTETKQGTVLSLTFEGTNLIGAKLTPYQIENYYQPRFVSTALGTTILNDVYSHSWWQ